MWRNLVKLPRSMKIILMGATAAAVLVSAGIAVAATTKDAPASQFTVVRGTIRAASGTPRPASGTEAKLWAGVSYATTTVEGSGRIVIGAVGDYCEGWPTISVFKDGREIGSTTIVSHTDYGTYRIGPAGSAGLPEGKHAIKITFTNDYVRSGKCDRNVALGYARMEHPAASVSPAATTAGPAPSTPVATPTATATSSQSAPGTPVARSAARHPFSSSSVWNTAIGSGAKFESRSAAGTAAFLGAKPVINRDLWSVAVRTTTTRDPLVTLNAVRNGKTYTIRIPADTVATGGTDKHVTLIQPDGVTAYDAFKFEKLSDGTWSAQIVVVTDLRGTGIGSGSRAAGVPAIAGLIRSEELAALRIPHALAVAVPNNVLKTGPVWPASRQDGDAATSYSGTVPMGSLLAIPGSVDIDALPLSAEGRALAHALQNYGAYVVDRAGTAALYCELACDAAQTARMTADWKILHSEMRMVTNSSATSVGGGGTPRIAAPPALS